ncbi:MAG: N-acetylneuraminate synthase family protein [Proteobacteria bacterium]|nr:N-acetylneuraminate synthase family protein [Pseudomonadota bacterium]
MPNIKPYIIAEIGCNHKGNMDIAREMIMVAAQFCKADAVKFQKRTNRQLLTPEEYNAPHPHVENSYGSTYGEHREFLEFTVEQHKELKEYCAKWNIAYSSSVWDLTAAQEIAEVNPPFIKIPSASNLDFEMLDWLCSHYKGEIQLSFGMTDRAEEEKIVTFFEERNRAMDVVILSCTSGYPVPFEDISLLEIPRFVKTYGQRIKAIGFSGHHLGIAPDVAALALGATVFERHFTLDRTWKGTDHAASLEPDGLRRLARDLRNVALALREKSEEILPIEKVQRQKLKRKVSS